MFSLLYGFYKLYCGREELRLLILGLDGAGKTVVLEQLKVLYSKAPGVGGPVTTTPTVGLNVGQISAGHHAVRLWDLGGLASLRSIWDKYYATAHAIIFVVDASAPARLDEAKVALEGAISNRALFEAPVLVLANKQDVEGVVSPGAMSEFLSPVLRSIRACKVQPASGLRGEGLKEGLTWLLAQIPRSSRTRLLRAQESAA